MRAEATPEDHAARAAMLAAYCSFLATTKLNRKTWDDDLLSEVEYQESLMADAITERRATSD
jgi:hypothetical protein